MKSQAIHHLGLVMLGCSCVLVGCSTTPLDATREAAREDAALPRDANTLLVGAELALERKEYRNAARILAEASALSDDESLAERATRVAYEHHQYSYVIKSANRWLQINSTSEEAHRYAGFAALHMYRIDAAAEHFEALIDTAFISPQAGFMALAPQWLEEGSRPAVMALARRLLPKYERQAEAHFVLAQAALQSENMALARSSAERAVSLSPYWTPGKLLLARVYLIGGQKEAALQIAREIVAQDGKPENRMELAQLLFAAGQAAEGQRELDALLVLPETAAAAQRMAALLELEQGQYEAAAKRFRELVKAGRFVYESMFYLGQIAEQLKATSDAIELYTRVTAGDLTIPAQTRAARLKARSGKPADGAAHLQEFGREHPEAAIEIIGAQAVVLADLDQRSQALELLDKGIQDYPDHESLRTAKALLLERMQRTPQAIAEMRALVRDRPDDPTALNMLGYTLVDQTRQTREGFAMIEQALAQVPDNGAVLDSMGWALHKLGRNEDALPYLQRAMEHARDAEVAVHIGEVQWALGKLDDARTTWQAALKDFPDSTELKERLEKRK
ncbi:MAG: tetratricopeptide repeat protein [Candidatus Obscuribacterales bacterium]|nr:tetratricopeptide repeat protein [Steroidobacteraceae bacterium]